MPDRLFDLLRSLAEDERDARMRLAGFLEEEAAHFERHAAKLRDWAAWLRERAAAADSPPETLS